MDIIFDIFFGFLVSLMGAFIGVVYPPNSPDWADWQKWGMALGVFAALILGALFLIVWFTDGSVLVLPLSIVGGVSLMGFLIIGNICRSYHEGR